MELKPYSVVFNITAVQILDKDFVEIADWCEGEVVEGRCVRFYDFKTSSWVEAYAGDWIFTDESGDFHRKTDAGFKAMFEENPLSNNPRIINPNNLNQAQKLAMLMHREAPLHTYSGRTWQDMSLKFRECQIEAARRILKALSEEDS